MRCLKCGRETDQNEKNVFCPNCLKVMEQFPVKPGTPVQISKRPTGSRRAPIHAAPKPEDVISGLRRKLRFHRIALAVVLTAFLFSGSVLGLLLYRVYTAPVIGSNYSTVSTDSTAP